MNFWGAPAILKEIAPMFGRIVVVHRDQICRLIGYAEDGMDCYYVVEEENGHVVWASAVGHIDPFVPSGETYEEVDLRFRRNGSVPHDKPRLVYTPKDIHTYWENFIFGE